VDLETTHNMDLDRYKQISSPNSSFDKKKIATIIPTPQVKDYKNGYIKRYFIQKANDVASPIYEIKQSSFSSFNSNPFYLAVSLYWRITGPIEDVKNSNRESVKIAGETIKKLYLYLPNLMQFYKK
jgi:hypothetical protein